MDYAAAIARVDGMIEDIKAYNRAWSELNNNPILNKSNELGERVSEADDALARDLAVVTVIAKSSTHVDWNHLAPSHPLGMFDRWMRSLEVLKNLRAELASVEEVAQIMGPTGPSMSASSLHPAIWNAALYLWNNGHYREAVQAAGTALDSITSAKTGTNLSGKDLFQEVFSAGPAQLGRPRLRFPHIPTTEKHTWTNQHEGTRNLSVGAMQLIRNITTHSLDPLDSNVAFEYLAVLSVVARQVEVGTVVEHGDPDPTPTP